MEDELKKLNKQNIAMGITGVEKSDSDSRNNPGLSSQNEEQVQRCFEMEKAMPDLRNAIRWCEGNKTKVEGMLAQRVSDGVGAAESTASQVIDLQSKLTNKLSELAGCNALSMKLTSDAETLQESSVMIHQEKLLMQEQLDIVKLGIANAQTDTVNCENDLKLEKDETEMYKSKLAKRTSDMMMQSAQCRSRKDELKTKIGDISSKLNMLNDTAEAMIEMEQRVRTCHAEQDRCIMAKNSLMETMEVKINETRAPLDEKIEFLSVKLDHESTMRKNKHEKYVHEQKRAKQCYKKLNETREDFDLRNVEFDEKSGRLEDKIKEVEELRESIDMNTKNMMGFKGWDEKY